MKRLLVLLAALAALGTSPAAEASTPIPWCGTDVVSSDRVPDATQGFAVHVVYAHPPEAPDRFVDWAPRIAGDVAAIDAWWRTQDPARAPRFDLFSFPCASVFGALDITRLPLGTTVGPIGTAFGNLREQLSGDFNASEKVYLVYYDGPTGQSGTQRVCGQGATPFVGLPGVALIYLDSCGSDTGEVVRPVVAVHELVHVLGAVANRAPHLCNSGHVCDVTNDLMAATLSGNELETHVLDGGRDDYYGHPGTWLDIQDSLFLERLDSPDRTAPSTPVSLNATGAATGSLRLTWAASTDDVGPVSYRITQDGHFVGTVPNPTTIFDVEGGLVTSLSIRAVDPVGHLSPATELLFKGGLGIVNAQGRLIRDTVRPPALGTVTVIRLTKRAAVASWRGVRDPGGLRGYRVRLGTRTVNVTKPTITIDPTKLRGAVTIAAVDRAGNLGPARTVPLRRFR